MKMKVKQSQIKPRNYQKLVDLIMPKCPFITTTDNQQLYYFNGKIYIPNQEWIIKKKCRLLEPKIKTYEVQVINYIKDLTYVDRSIFDSNPDLLVVENGTLNIHTLHTANHYALSMLPVRYNPNAICPEFSKFLKDLGREKGFDAHVHRLLSIQVCQI